MKQSLIFKYAIVAASVVLVGGASTGIAIHCLAGPASVPTVQYAAAATAVQTTAVTTTATTETAANAAQSSDWRLTLVNKDNAVPETYEAQLMTLSNGKQVDERMYPDLQDMFDTMRADGVYPVVREGYRTDEDQQAAMQDQIDQYISEGYDEEEAETMAKSYVALPGYSEHQLGLAVDINADTSYSDNETVYNWLAEHAAEYGFILRYPEEKEDVTGITYEPWHYRYVGKENAAEITASGLCLEEYLAEGNGAE